MKFLLLAALALPACVDPMAQHAAEHARAVQATGIYSQQGQTTTVTTTTGPARGYASPAVAPARQEPVEVIIRTDDQRNGRYYGPMDIANSYSDSLR